MNLKVVPKTQREADIEAMAEHLYSVFQAFEAGIQWHELKDEMPRGIVNYKKRWWAIAEESIKYLKQQPTTSED